MRKFSSYGPVDKDLHYYVPREDLIQNACRQLVGDDPEKGGHYITVWAPRQCGKTWTLNEVFWRLKEDHRFHVLKMELEHLKMTEDRDVIVHTISQEIIDRLKLRNIRINRVKEFETLFKKDILDKPLILILDEFDALAEDAISGIVGAFRNIWNRRRKDAGSSAEKEFLLHSVALIGVRSVLGVENVKGSPFNVQRSMRIPNLTFEETESMFRWYERESGQKVEGAVIDSVFRETRGQPGLVSWLGELLTEGFDRYTPDRSRPLASAEFDHVYAAAIQILPNNNILNIISKARQEPYRQFVLDLFRTDEKIPFRFDDSRINFLYMNGVVDMETENGHYFVRFACPFVQKRLFNFFANELFDYVGVLHDPFADLSDVVTPKKLNVRNLFRLYETYLRKNRQWLLSDAPRRKDLRVFEAVYHFNLYEYLSTFFQSRGGRVWPEFPTGNGKIDLLIRYANALYAIELKSFTNEADFRQSLRQAAGYGKALNLKIIYMAVFVDAIPNEYREKYEADYADAETGVTVSPIFVATGAD